ncbi:UDP-glucose 4-epimerase GalE [Angustibacter sp. Root456]|uniref:UDP-glucose 4-epimerase GalE n=1 Tax=Angustibacter sp. Root456 TaxID=1736539 RepID=UPI0006FD0654|nr:UDP-glucose 4-epimerase GalE [Angustibacter sp. Root456]KQX69940.1 UDP-glucose 4-epimerase [Angustibacter sp. Root456]
MTWLVTGGAGYIGAHVVRALREDGVDVVVLDDLSTGDASRIGDVPLVQASLLDRDAVDRTIVEHDVRGVVHIAAKKQVGESVADPFYYYRQNVLGQLVLMESMRDHGVGRFVFSSSAATYGAPDTALVEEKSHLEPESPYGQTKVVGEWLAKDAEAAYGVRSVCLRYFNVAGAATPELGDPEALNLIPMVFERLTRGERPQIFGDDYPTPDGTCIRDYIHVADIATAHVSAARYLEGEGSSLVLNIGRGEGSSVREVIDMVGEVTGLDVTADVVARRPGDPPRTVASADGIRRWLGWEAQYDLRDMVSSAWDGWTLRHPEALDLPRRP